jgi:hypothetical protein
VKKLFRLVIICSVTLFLAVPGFTQTSDKELKTIMKEIESIKQGQTTIQKELREIKDILQTKQAAPQKPQDIVLSINDAYVKGDKNAKLTLIEFTDIQ